MRADKVNPVSQVQKHLAKLERSVSDMESICTRCGDCCKSTFKANGSFVVVPELPCRFLMVKSDGKYHCSVYNDRFHAAPWCRDLMTGMLTGAYPVSCNYTKGLPGYVGGHVLSDQQYEIIRPSLQKATRLALEQDPAAEEFTKCFHPEDLAAFLDEDGLHKAFSDDSSGDWLRENYPVLNPGAHRAFAQKLDRLSTEKSYFTGLADDTYIGGYIRKQSKRPELVKAVDALISPLCRVLGFRETDDLRRACDVVLAYSVGTSRSLGIIPRVLNHWLLDKAVDDKVLEIVLDSDWYQDDSVVLRSWEALILGKALDLGEMQVAGVKVDSAKLFADLALFKAIAGIPTDALPAGREKRLPEQPPPPPQDKPAQHLLSATREPEEEPPQIDAQPYVAAVETIQEKLDTERRSVLNADEEDQLQAATHAVVGASPQEQGTTSRYFVSGTRLLRRRHRMVPQLWTGSEWEDQPVRTILQAQPIGKEQATQLVGRDPEQLGNEKPPVRNPHVEYGTDFVRGLNPIDDSGTPGRRLEPCPYGGGRNCLKHGGNGAHRHFTGYRHNPLLGRTVAGQPIRMTSRRTQYTDEDRDRVADMHARIGEGISPRESRRAPSLQQSDAFTYHYLMSRHHAGKDVDVDLVAQKYLAGALKHHAEKYGVQQEPKPAAPAAEIPVEKSPDVSEGTTPCRYGGGRKCEEHGGDGSSHHPEEYLHGGGFGGHLKTPNRAFLTPYKDKLPDYGRKEQQVKEFFESTGIPEFDVAQFAGAAVPEGYSLEHLNVWTNTDGNNNKKLVVDLEFVDDEGNPVGEATRELHHEHETGKIWVYHNAMFLNKSVQGKKLADSAYKKLFNLYAKIGVDYVKMTANGSSGYYAWGKKGFDFASEHTRDGWIEDLKLWLIRNNLRLAPGVDIERDLQHTWDFMCLEAYNPDGTLYRAKVPNTHMDIIGHAGKVWKFMHGGHWPAIRRLKDDLSNLVSSIEIPERIDPLPDPSSLGVTTSGKEVHFDSFTRNTLNNWSTEDHQQAAQMHYAAADDTDNDVIRRFHREGGAVHARTATGDHTYVYKSPISYLRTFVGHHRGKAISDGEKKWAQQKFEADHSFAKTRTGRDLVLYPDLSSFRLDKHWGWQRDDHLSAKHFYSRILDKLAERDRPSNQGIRTHTPLSPARLYAHNMVNYHHYSGNAELAAVYKNQVDSRQIFAFADLMKHHKKEILGNGEGQE